MKRWKTALLGLFATTIVGCNTHKQNDNVLSERYVHKYGYALTKAEWESQNCPGQIITTLADGRTISSTYEGGYLHGPMTVTYPYSQTVEHYALYNQDVKVKETFYDPMGVPTEEWIQLSPTRYSRSLWYQEGSPLMVEEYVGEELLEGQYFSLQNTIESSVEKGAGTRIRRDRTGLLLSKEIIEQGYPLKKETFYPNGSPETIAFYHRGNLHGEKRAFALTGEPLSIEEWVSGKLHGKATYFKNGNRYLEISYLYGQKSGIERHYVDGEILSQEVYWENDLKHGPSVCYLEGKAQKQWFYAGESVSKRKFDELVARDEIIAGGYTDHGR